MAMAGFGSGHQPRQQQTQVIRQQQGGRGGGGLLRSLLRPFMPEVSAGLDVASSLLHGDAAGAVRGAAGMAGDMMEEAPPVINTAKEAGDSVKSAADRIAEEGGGVDPGEVPDVSPAQPQQMMAMNEEGDPNEMEPDGDGDDFSPEQLQSLQMISQQFPGLDGELQADPGLLDGAGNLVSKLSRYYKRQRSPQQPMMA